MTYSKIGDEVVVKQNAIITAVSPKLEFEFVGEPTIFTRVAVEREVGEKVVSRFQVYTIEGKSSTHYIGRDTDGCVVLIAKSDLSQ
jgi:hypothetical protein